MASFAPGTSQQYMNDYYRRVGPSLGGTGPEMPRPPMARPDSRNSVVSSGGRSSPYGQPSNRPFQGTLPPVVPQQQSPDMSAYSPGRSAGMRWTGTEWKTPQARPGRAQPTPPPSQGTPYSPGRPRHSPNDNIIGVPPGPYRPGTFQPIAWGPDGREGTADDRPSPDYGPGWPAGLRPDAVRPSITVNQPPSVTPGGGPGNFANMPPDLRPPPFTATTTGWSGKQADPSQLFAQRDAFVQSINDARAPLALRAGMGMGGPPPQRDFGQLWGRAGDMVSQGWQNPLTGLMGAAGPRTVTSEVRSAPPPRSSFSAGPRGASGGFGIRDPIWMPPPGTTQQWTPPPPSARAWQ